MARLSRTQKYQDLREQINNDSEALGKTEELNNLQNKLDNIQNNFNSTVTQTVEPVEATKQVETVNPFTEIKTEEVNSNVDPFEDAEDAFNKLLAKLEENNDNATKAVEDLNAFTDPFAQPAINFDGVKVEAEPEVQVIPPVGEPVEVEPAPVEVVEPNQVVEETAKIEEPAKVEDTTVEEPKKEEEEELVNVIDTSTEAIADTMEQIDEELNGKIEPVQDEPVQDESVQDEPVQDEPAKVVEAPVEEKPVEVKPVDTNYVDAALKEVADYNKNDGRKTLDEISDGLIDTIRHPEDNKLNTNKDDEFSNTVSIELDKVLTEISNTQQIQTLKEEKEVVKEEHPVLTKKQDDGIEIKSMEETLAQEALEQTIPFKAETQTIQEVVDEEIEEDDSAPNKILNVILIILIVILIAILGVIVYYILYAKGIIG